MRPGRRVAIAMQLLPRHALMAHAAAPISSEALWNRCRHDVNCRYLYSVHGGGQRSAGKPGKLLHEFHEAGGAGVSDLRSTSVCDNGVSLLRDRSGGGRERGRRRRLTNEVRLTCTPSSTFHRATHPHVFPRPLLSHAGETRSGEEEDRGRVRGKWPLGLASSCCGRHAAVFGSRV